MMISADTGNKMIKTDAVEFSAGLQLLDQMPGEQEAGIYGEKKKNSDAPEEREKGRMTKWFALMQQAILQMMRKYH